jgi:hypothetical protein
VVPEGPPTASAVARWRRRDDAARVRSIGQERRLSTPVVDERAAVAELLARWGRAAADHDPAQVVAAAIRRERALALPLTVDVEPERRAVLGAVAAHMRRAGEARRLDAAWRRMANRVVGAAARRSERRFADAARFELVRLLSTERRASELAVARWRRRAAAPKPPLPATARVWLSRAARFSAASERAAEQACYDRLVAAEHRAAVWVAWWWTTRKQPPLAHVDFDEDDPSV